MKSRGRSEALEPHGHVPREGIRDPRDAKAAALRSLRQPTLAEKIDPQANGVLLETIEKPAHARAWHEENETASRRDARAEIAKRFLRIEGEIKHPRADHAVVMFLEGK